MAEPDETYINACFIPFSRVAINNLRSTKNVGMNPTFFVDIKYFMLAASYSPLASTIATTVLDFRVRNGIGYTHCVKPPT